MHKPLPQKLHGIIFDMDGVIADTERVKADVTRQMLAAEFGIMIDYEDFHYQYSGRKFSEVIKILLHDQTEETIAEFTKRRYEEVLQRLPKDCMPVPGIYELLDFLDDKKIPYGVSTGASKATAEVTLKTMNITHRLQAVSTSGDVTNGKPHPEPYLRTAKLMGLDISQTVAIEDAENGIKAAKGAGLFVIGLQIHSTDRQLIEADKICYDHHEVLANLKQVLGQ
jgi:HAD superfamily hydrolase (TIGR01509 family)